MFDSDSEMMSSDLAEDFVECLHLKCYKICWYTNRSI